MAHLDVSTIQYVQLGMAFFRVWHKWWIRWVGVACNDLWTCPVCICKGIQLCLCNKTARIWHILTCPLYIMYSTVLIIFIWHKWSLAWEDVSHAMTLDLDLYLKGYLAATPISCIIFICGPNTTHEGTMCYIPYPGQRQGHTGRSHFCSRGGKYSSRSLICNT